MDIGGVDKLQYAGVDVLVYAIVVGVGIYLMYYWRRVARRRAEKAKMETTKADLK